VPSSNTPRIEESNPAVCDRIHKPPAMYGNFLPSVGIHITDRVLLMGQFDGVRTLALRLSTMNTARL
jgi:hypothetical protein